jgi:hypothetical protein
LRIIPATAAEAADGAADTKTEGEEEEVIIDTTRGTTIDIRPLNNTGEEDTAAEIADPIVVLPLTEVLPLPVVEAAGIISM